MSLNLSGTNPGKPCTRPPSCTTPRKQLCVLIKYLNFFNILWTQSLVWIWADNVSSQILGGKTTSRLDHYLISPLSLSLSHTHTHTHKHTHIDKQIQITIFILSLARTLIFSITRFSIAHTHTHTRFLYSTPLDFPKLLFPKYDNNLLFYICIQSPKNSDIIKAKKNV